MEYNSYFCPICGKAYAKNPINCKCGFEGIQYKYDPDELAFRVYKYAKDVFCGRREYEISELICEERDGVVLIRDFKGKRGLEVICAPSETHTLVEGGIVALNRNTRALIINADALEGDLLDESIVTSLFLGERVKGIEGGYFRCGGLKYITVAEGNPYLKSEGNVLFDRQITHLICYPPKKTDEEYIVPQSVKTIGQYAFRFTGNLRRLYLPNGVHLAKDALYPADNNIEILYY